MKSEIENLLFDYYAWLKEKTNLKEVADWIEITTPYLDRHNDYIQIYAQKHGENITLTDDGYIIGDLKFSGCAVDSPKRTELLKQVLNGFGVQKEGDALVAYAEQRNFPLKKHNLVQAMLAVDDLFYTTKSTILSLFLEEVTGWLDQNDVRYTPNVKLPGKSGYDHMFNFVIPKSKEYPERVVQTLNKPNKTNTENFLFAWSDTKSQRSPEAKAYTILNDSSESVNNDVISALTKYDINPVLWTVREQYIGELAA